jgi:hypothetical protein
MRFFASTLGFSLAAGLAVGAPEKSPAVSPAPASAAGREFLTTPIQAGGVAYGYLDFRGDLEKILRQLTADMAKEEPVPGEFNFRQDYVQIAQELGLAQISGLSFSSVERGGGFENRTFMAIDGPRQGLLAALGGPAKPFTGARYAPADADVLVDLEVDAGQLMKTIAGMVARFDPATAAKMLFEISGNANASPLQFLHALSRIKGRVTLWAKLDDVDLSRRPQFFLRVEGPAKALRGLLEKESGTDRRTVDGREIFFSRESGDVDFPVAHLDGDTVYVAGSLAQLTESLARSTGSLQQEAGYARMLGELGDRGNSLIYLAPQFTRKVYAALNAQFKPWRRSDVIGRGFFDAFGLLLPASEIPVLSILENRADGIFVRSWEPQSNKRALIAFGLMNPELIGIYTNALVRSQYAEINARQLAARARPRIEENLQKIDAAARRYFEATPDAYEVAWPQLIEAEPALGAIQPVFGESYTEIMLTRGFSVIEVSMQDYSTVRHVRPLTPEQEKTILANLRLIDEAAARYFAASAERTTMYFGEAAPFLSDRPMIERQADENYDGVTVERTAKRIEITLPGERTLGIDRDPAFVWTARREQIRAQQTMMEKLQPAFTAAQAYFADPENQYQASVYLSLLVQTQRVAAPDFGQTPDAVVEPPMPPSVAGASDAAAAAATESIKAAEFAAAPPPPAAVTAAVDATDHVSPAQVSEAVVEPAVVQEAGPAIAFDVLFSRGRYDVEFYHDGRNHRVLFPLEDEKRKRVLENLRAIARAAAPELAKTKEIALYPGELVGPKKPLAKLPDPVFDEDYATLELRPTDTAITLTLSTGHTLTVPLAGK